MFNHGLYSVKEFFPLCLYGHYDYVLIWWTEQPIWGVCEDRECRLCGTHQKDCQKDRCSQTFPIVSLVCPGPKGDVTGHKLQTKVNYDCWERWLKISRLWLTGNTCSGPQSQFFFIIRILRFWMNHVLDISLIHAGSWQANISYRVTKQLHKQWAHCLVKGHHTLQTNIKSLFHSLPVYLESQLESVREQLWYMLAKIAISQMVRSGSKVLSLCTRCYNLMFAMLTFNNGVKTKTQN